MDSIHLIRENLGRSEEIVLAGVEEMAAYGMVAPTPRGGCHTLWVLGHLAYIEGMVIHTFMLGDPNPLNDWSAVFDGAEVDEDPTAYPTFDDVLAECRATRAATMRLVDRLSESDLDRPAASCPDTMDRLFGTYRRCLQYTADHWFMHRGQLADARRAAGLDRMWF